MTRADLRRAVYDCCPSLSRKEASKLLDEFFDDVGEALARGEPCFSLSGSRGSMD